MQNIYLDNNASTLIAPEVIEEMSNCMRAGFYNPASPHLEGQRARQRLELAKSQLLSLLGASQRAPRRDHLIITSGGTEANNLAIRGLPRQPGHLLISAIEHPSALGAAESLRRLGYEIEVFPVLPSGQIDPLEVTRRFRPNTQLVCAMLANHEVGTIQPIHDLAGPCRERRILLHCDAVQWIGKFPFCFETSGVHSVSFSAHKFHGPTGVGGLIVRHGTELQPILFGGSQQLGLRPGTESIPLVAGMTRALELALLECSNQPNKLANLRDHFQSQLTCRLADVVVHGASAPRLPQTLNVSFLGVDRQALVMALDLAGIACSTGSACSSGSSQPSHVLLAMGGDPTWAESAVRFGLSRFTTPDEIDQAIERIIPVVNRLRR